MAEKKGYKRIMCFVLAAFFVCGAFACNAVYRPERKTYKFSYSGGNYFDSNDGLGLMGTAALTETDKSNILSALQNWKTQIDDGYLDIEIENSISDPDEIKNELEELIFENPQYGFINALSIEEGASSISLLLYDSDIITAFETEIENTKNSIDAGWSALKKISFVNDYLTQKHNYNSTDYIENFEYQSRSPAHLLASDDKEGDSVAFSLVMKLLLNYCGIENKLAKTNDGYIWNQVKLEDNWYNIDTAGEANSKNENTNIAAGVFRSLFLVKSSAITTGTFTGETTDTTYTSNGIVQVNAYIRNGNNGLYGSVEFNDTSEANVILSSYSSSGQMKNIVISEKQENKKIYVTDEISSDSAGKFKLFVLDENNKPMIPCTTYEISTK